MDVLDHPTAEMMVERGRVKAALLAEADLVEWGENIERSTPAACITFFVQRLKVSWEAKRIGGTVVRKRPVVDPLQVDVLSR